MSSALKVLIGVTAATLMWSHSVLAEKSKQSTALAADVWNSFQTRDDLEIFLSAGKTAAEKAAVKKILSGASKKTSTAVFKGDVVQFGAEKTRWTIDSEGGVWVDGKLFVVKPKSSLTETLKQFEQWQKENKKTSMMNLFVPTANAQNLDSLPDDDKKAYLAFMEEFSRLVRMNCMYQMGDEVLNKLATKLPEGSTRPKITSMGIICEDQNSAKEAIYTAASGRDVVISMNGEFATSPSTGKNYLKKVRIHMNGENAVNVNLIESNSPQGSELHTMDVLFGAGRSSYKLDVNQVRAKFTSSCTADLAQRMVMSVHNVCKSIKGSSFAQRGFGQMSGPPPEEKAPAAAKDQAK